MNFVCFCVCEFFFPIPTASVRISVTAEHVFSLLSYLELYWCTTGSENVLEGTAQCLFTCSWFRSGTHLNECSCHSECQISKDAGCVMWIHVTVSGHSRSVLLSYLCASLSYSALPLLLPDKPEIERRLCTYTVHHHVPENRTFILSHVYFTISWMSITGNTPIFVPSPYFPKPAGNAILIALQFTLHLLTRFTGFRSY